TDRKRAGDRQGHYGQSSGFLSSSPRIVERLGPTDRQGQWLALHDLVARLARVGYGEAPRRQAPASGYRSCHGTIAFRQQHSHARASVDRQSVGRAADATGGQGLLVRRSELDRNRTGSLKGATGKAAAASPT